jgi:hypothetical protein
MRHETYRFALDEASAELRTIVTQYEALRIRKEQVEKVVEALKPFLSLQTEIPAAETDAIEVTSDAEMPVTEPAEFVYMQVSGPSTESVQVSAELHEEAFQANAEATAEQVAYFRQPSADPFQRRIDDALWGWQQRPEGLLSPI